jgi:hypothetical protein
MADKKITALTAVADSEIGADDLLHIVDNPGGTPVNKKMTISQLFENIPTHLAVDDIATLTASASNLASTFATFIDGTGFGGDILFTLDNGTDVGQLKIILASTEPASTHKAKITVNNWGYSGTASEQIKLDTQGEAVVLMWNGTKWFVVANTGATLT